MADLPRTDNNSYFSDAHHHSMKKSEVNKSFILDLGVARLEATFGVKLTVKGEETDTRDFVMIIEVPDGGGAFQIGAADSGVYNGTVQWGDGNADVITAFNDVALTHTYAAGGEYEVRVLADSVMPRMTFSGAINRDWIKRVSNMGHIGLTSLQNFLADCDGLEDGPNDEPGFKAGNCDLTQVGITQEMFVNCLNSFTIDFTNVDMSAWENSRAMFQNTPAKLVDFTGVTVTPIFDFMRGMLLNMDGAATDPVIRMADLFIGQAANMQGICEANVGHMDIDLPDWDITNLTNFAGFFSDTIQLNTDLYDATLISWAAQAPVNAQVFKAGLSTYTPGGLAEAARTTLINTYGWTITDGGPAAA